MMNALICLAVLLVPAAAAGEEVLVWFGTYTRPGTGSEGIYTARFDTDRGRFSEPVLAASARNPSFLVAHPRLPILYAVSEVSGSDGKPAGAVTAFELDERTGRLEDRGAASSGGAGPCHLAVDPAGTMLLVANYGGGSVACLGLATDGRLAPIVSGERSSGLLQHEGDRSGEPGVDPTRQANPHAHSVDLLPGRDAATRQVVVCDLGLDRVFVHRCQADRATLEPGTSAATAAGAGPRHFALHPDGMRGWCVNELDLTVTGFEWDGDELIPRQTLSTLPPDAADRRGCSGAEISVHPAGRFLYTSNRGHDSIAMFRIAAAGPALEFLGAEPARVKTPRHFAIAPGGRFLVAAGQDSGSVTVFAIDQATGRLSVVGESLTVPAPVCVLFRP